MEAMSEEMIAHGDYLKHDIFKIATRYFGVKEGKITIAVNPAYTSLECSRCGTIVKKPLSLRTRVCQCGFILDRD